MLSFDQFFKKWLAEGADEKPDDDADEHKISAALVKIMRLAKDVLRAGEEAECNTVDQGQVCREDGDDRLSEQDDNWT